MLSWLLRLFFITTVAGFTPRLTTIKASRNVDACAIFFTGGSTFIHHDIYRSFLSKLVAEGTDIYIYPFHYAGSAAMVRNLQNRYPKVAAVAHSSGATVALNKCGGHAIKFVLMDPVNTRIGNLNEPFYISPKTPSVLFIHALKSFKINRNPFGLPFIPFTSLRIRPASIRPASIRPASISPASISPASISPASISPASISPASISPASISPKTVFKTVEFDEHGHADILDHIFADFMHNTRISVGTCERDTLEEYHTWLAKTVHLFICD